MILDAWGWYTGMTQREGVGREEDETSLCPSGFLSVYAQQWDCWIIRQFYFQFFKESPHCSP